MSWDVPQLEPAATQSESDSAVRMSPGGIAYELTPEQLEQLTPEEREKIRSEPRGGVAYYLDINDQLQLRNDQDEDTHPPLVNPRTFETERRVRTHLRTNHHTDSDQEDNDSENMSTSYTKTLNLSPSYNLSNDGGNISYKTVETSSTTVSRGESESNKTYTVTITTTQIDDSEA